MTGKLIRLSGTALGLFLIVICVSAPSYGQDRDLDAGSSSGSVRPDIADRSTESRSRMATPESRRKFINEEFDKCRALAGTLATTTDELRASYEPLLARYLAVRTQGRPGEGLLTPRTYMLARIIQQQYNSTYPRVTGEAIVLAELEGKNRRQALISLGMSNDDAGKAIKQSGTTLKNSCK